MNIHEYQAKRLFKEHGIPVLKGFVAYTPEEAERQALKIGGDGWAVKAQIHSAMRDKGQFLEKEAGTGSGLRMVNSPLDAKIEAEKMLGKTLVTPLTGADGREVKKVYIEEWVGIKHAFSLSIYIDFDKEKTFIKMDDVSKGAPVQKALHELDLQKKLSMVKSLTLAAKLKLSPIHIKKVADILRSMYDLFKNYNAFEVIIDPLVITTDNRMVALDGKIFFDPDALSKFKEIESLRDLEEESPQQIKARLNNFRYHTMNGNIGCIINGSGLGMATLDLLHLYGGRPACILDLGGDLNRETVANGFKMILSEPNVEGVLINIFGGGTRCDIVAEGLIAAAREISVGMPLVVRMDGTNAQIGCRLLFESGLPFTVIETMNEAVKDIIRLVQEVL